MGLVMMRSSWSRVGAYSEMTGVFIKGKNLDTGTHTGECREHTQGQRPGTELCL